MLYKLKAFLNKNRCYCEMQINNLQLEKMVKEGAILLDVRSIQEYEEEHLENAICLPVYEIKRKYTETLPDKTKTIVVYCSTGHRSERAQKILKKLGYEKVFNLCKGLENYYWPFSVLMLK